jgi:hypothetical protein
LVGSFPESAGERREQCALGLQKIAPNRQLVCVPKIEILLGVLAKTPGESRPIIQNLRGADISQGLWRLLVEPEKILDD